jgi:hypothetical protein
MCSDLIEVLSRHFPGGTGENHVRIDRVPAETRTEHLLDASLERYL